MKLNEAAVAQALYENALTRLIRVYNLPEEPATPAALVEVLLGSLDQPALEDLDVSRSDGDVYKAAVRALGSGMRSWTKFIANEDALKKALGNPDAYDPAVAADKDPTDLIGFVPGVNQGSTAGAIIAWAHLLKQEPSYYSRLLELYDQAASLGSAELGSVTPSEVMIIVTCLQAAGPSRAWQGTRLHKWPGMKYALGSEFLRNLGWNGFKPDTHVIRLLNRWAHDVVEAQEHRATELVRLAGRSDRELIEGAKYSLAGIAITPSGMTYSKTDNLLWLLGSQVVKNNKKEKPTYTASDFFTEA